jgi:hypothetical protein
MTTELNRFSKLAADTGAPSAQIVIVPETSALLQRARAEAFRLSQEHPNDTPVCTVMLASGVRWHLWLAVFSRDVRQRRDEVGLSGITMRGNPSLAVFAEMLRAAGYSQPQIDAGMSNVKLDPRSCRCATWIDTLR